MSILYHTATLIEFQVDTLSQHQQLRTIESRFSPTTLRKWLTLSPTRVDVKLPKFKIESNLSLNEILTSMGMKQAFSPINSDFSGISDDREGLFISDALHKAYVDVNEEGTEAAAATAIVMRAAGISIEPAPISGWF